jgi:diguanylate cyclase (GGDEF)-like protein
MYDPLIVDTFIKVHKKIAPDPISANNETNAVEGVRKGFKDLPSVAGTPRLEEIAASSDEMQTLYALARSLAGHSNLADAGNIVAAHLRRLVPSSLCVFFLYDRKLDDLEAAIVFGEASSLVTGLRIPLGQRLSGWVAANQQTIVNSDPSLDLGDIARAISPRLRSCLSTALLVDSQLVGTLSLYSEIVDGFNENHRRIIETVAKQVGHAFARPSNVEAPMHHDPVTGLPNVNQLEQLFDSSRPSRGEQTGLTLLLVDVVDLERINARYGRAAGDETLHHVVRQARIDLPVGHLLFRCESDEFVVVLTQCDHQAAETIAGAIRDRVRSNPILFTSGQTLSIDISVTRVVAPPNSSSLTDLIATARRRSQPQAPASSTVH